MGVSGDQYAQHGALEQSSGFATGLGEGDLTASSKFMQGILSGDASKITSVLSPLISSAKTSAQQTQKTNTEMGTRSGGTTASNIAATDKGHSDITSAIAGLTGTAATTLGTEGAGLLSAGMAGDQVGFDQAGAIQKQKLAKFNDIISSIAATAGAVAGIPMGGGSAAPTAASIVGTPMPNPMAGVGPNPPPLDPSVFAGLGG